MITMMMIPINVTLVGTTTDVILEQPWNAMLPDDRVRVSDDDDEDDYDDDDHPLVITMMIDIDNNNDDDDTYIGSTTTECH